MNSLQVENHLLRVTEEDGRTTVQFHGCPRLTEDNADAVGNLLLALIEDRGQIRLCLDLGEVEYLTSVALGKFLVLNGQVRRQGGELMLVNLRPSILKIFKVSRLDRVIDICEEVQAA